MGLFLALIVGVDGEQGDVSQVWYRYFGSSHTNMKRGRVEMKGREGREEESKRCREWREGDKADVNSL